MSVDLLQYLRPQRHFDDPRELAAAIRADVERARQAFLE
jgi:FAD synthase